MLTAPRYQSVLRLTCYSFDGRGNWFMLDKVDGDLFTLGPWLKYHPLRVGVIGKHKAGVATNLEELKKLVASIGQVERIPYEYGQRIAADQAAFERG